MRDRLVYPRIVALGKPATEPVDEGRIRLADWLIGELTGDHTRVIRYDRTVFLTMQELVDSPDQVTVWLKKSGIERADGSSALVLDLTQNAYDLLHEPLLAKLGAFVADWASAYEDIVCVILLPHLPPSNISIFWPPLLTDGLDGRVYVISNSGEIWTPRKPSAAEIEIAHEYSLRLELPDHDEIDWVKAMIIGELGHFKVDAPDGSYCARYFFDAQLVIPELANKIRKMVESVDLPAGKQPILLHHGARSDWLRKACLLAGGALDVPVQGIAEATDATGLMTPNQVAIPVFDVVNSGATCARVVSDLIAQGTPVADTVVCALIDRDCRVTLPDGLQLVHVLEVECDKVTSSECDQCKLELPHTAPLSSESTLRPFDAWEILFRFDWIAEPYGPEGQVRYGESPDMARIIEMYGPWLAHRIAVLVDSLNVQQYLVFVCPGERVGEDVVSIVDLLVGSLAPRLRDRLVVVRVPRDYLDFGDTEDDDDNRPPWKEQLKHVGSARHRSVILLDEFNASNTTAAALNRVLRESGVRADAYVTVLDRVPNSAKSLGVPTYALYSVPNPRRQRAATNG